MVLGLSNVSRGPARRFITRAIYMQDVTYVRLTQPLGIYFYIRNRKSKSKTLLSFVVIAMATAWYMQNQF